MSDISNIINLKYKHDSILRDIRFLSSGKMARSSENINKLNADVESYLTGVEELKKFCVDNRMSKKVVEQCVGFANDGLIFENAVLHFSIDFKLNESRYGFYNPFDDYDEDSNDELPSVDIHTKSKDGITVLGLKLWNMKKKGNVYFDGDGVFSGRVFYPEDEIECVPVRLFKNEDLYSRAIRDVAFEIDLQKRIYGLPSGLVSHMKNSFESKKTPNAQYETFQDKDGNWYIRVFAIDKIHRNEEIVLQSDETDMANELHPYDFRYDNENNDTLYKANYYPLNRNK